MIDLPYCPKCGSPVSEDAQYCAKCGSPVRPAAAPSVTVVVTPAPPPPPPPPPTYAAPPIPPPPPAPAPVLAGWGSRFIAWLIDIILVDAAVEVLGFVFLLPFLATGFSPFRMMRDITIVPPYWTGWMLRFVGARDVLRFLYWVGLEGLYNGQSLGKKLMRISVVDLEGKRIGLLKAAVESFGKAFMLPIDVIVGLIAFGGKHQRLFNALSGTLVVRSRIKH